MRWRRYLPKKKSRIDAPLSDGLSLRTVQSVADASNLSDRMKQAGEPELEHEKLRYYRTLLVAQSPRAVLAQWKMDTHKYGYRNRKKRLFELIDFNDTLVNVILLTPVDDRFNLASSLKYEIDQFCRKLNTPRFSEEQFEAIVLGLGREVAVYTAAQDLGYDVRMTSRTEDAFGIDMIIEQPSTGKKLYIDCKTPSAFRHRLEDLVKYHQITEEQLLQADKDDYLTALRHDKDKKLPVTLLCIRTETLGAVHSFVFDEPKRVQALLEKIFASLNAPKRLDIFVKKW